MQIDCSNCPQLFYTCLNSCLLTVHSHFASVLSYTLASRMLVKLMQANALKVVAHESFSLAACHYPANKISTVSWMRKRHIAQSPHHSS